MNRDLVELVQRLVTLVPDSEHGLRTDLTRVIGKAKYRAPEVIRQSWLDGARVLYEYMGPPERFEPGSWQERVYALWMDEAGQ